jgi:hypothetical protein
MLKSRLTTLGVTAVALVAGASVAAAAPAGAATHGSAKWGIALQTASSANFPYFSAGAVVSASNAWAFEAADANVKPVAYLLSGGKWRQQSSFPGVKGQFVVSAFAPASNDVWAFTQGTSPRALRFSGRWKVLKTFSKPINSGLALSATDAWVFGDAFPPELGNLHYNGKTWANTGGPALQGASALSANSLWAYGMNEVAHWNGHSWSATSVKRLLPKGNEVCGSGSLTGIYAASARNVYAIGAGGCPDGQGPFILLHYNGHKWSKVNVGKSINADPLAIISDGSGGVWITALTGAPPISFIEHYANGKLTKASLPVTHLALIGGAATAAHTTTAFAFGSHNNAVEPTKSAGLILRYGS